MQLKGVLMCSKAFLMIWLLPLSLSLPIPAHNHWPPQQTRYSATTFAQSRGITMQMGAQIPASMLDLPLVLDCHWYRDIIFFYLPFLFFLFSATKSSLFSRAGRNFPNVKGFEYINVSTHKKAPVHAKFILPGCPQVNCTFLQSCLLNQKQCSCASLGKWAPPMDRPFSLSLASPSMASHNRLNALMLTKHES